MVDVTGQIIPQMPTLPNPEAHRQQINGSALEAASRTTIESNAQLASMAKALGAGQKGASRRRRHTKKKAKRGGASLNATPLGLPTANSIPGVNADDTHVKLAGIRAQNIVNGVGDKLANAQPMILGGKRRTRKAKNGHRRHRTHRRSRK
jgi:hypothetical protein